MVDRDLLMVSAFGPGRFMNMDNSATSASHLEWYVREFVERGGHHDDPFGFCHRRLADVVPRLDDPYFHPFLYGSRRAPNTERASTGWRAGTVKGICCGRCSKVSCSSTAGTSRCCATAGARHSTRPRCRGAALAARSVAADVRRLPRHADQRRRRGGDRCARRRPRRRRRRRSLRRLRGRRRAHDPDPAPLRAERRHASSTTTTDTTPMRDSLTRSRVSGAAQQLRRIGSKRREAGSVMRAEAARLEGRYDYIIVGAGTAGCVLGEPSERGPADPRPADRGRRERPLSLGPHPGRLPLLHREPAHRLEDEDRGRARPERTIVGLSSRQAARGLHLGERHDLHARTGGRLRPTGGSWAMSAGGGTTSCPTS